MPEFIDLDSETEEDLLAANSRFRVALDWMDKKNDPFRMTIGLWICRGSLDHAQAARLLMFFDAYKEVPPAKRDAYLPLSVHMVEFFFKNPGKRINEMPGADTFLYHAMVTMRTVMMFYTTDEQAELLDKLLKKFPA